MVESAKTMLAAIVGGALYGLLAYACIEWTRDGGRIAAVWLPNALALALLLRLRMAREPLLLGAMGLGNALAAHLAGDSVIKAMTLTSCNLLEIVVALILARRLCGPRPAMEQIDHLARFVGAAGIAAPAVSATLATLALGLEDPLDPAVWGNWFAAHSLGMIVLAPAVLILCDGLVNPRRPSRRALAEWAVLTLGGATVAAGVFLQDSFPLLFLVAPVVVLNAFRLGSLGTAVSVLVVAAVATLCTWRGTGPLNLIEGSLGVRLTVLQAFLAAAFAMGLPVAAVLAKNRRLLTRIDEHGTRLHLLTHTIADAVVRFDRHGLCTYASPSVEAVLGLPPDAFLGRRASDHAHPQARTAIAEVEARLFGGQSERERITYRRSADDEQGAPVFIEADAALARDPATGCIDGIVVCARNVTDRVGLERELARAQRLLAQAGDARATFVTGMGSAIRSRLEHLQVAALQLAHAELAPPQQRQADAIAASGARLLRLLGAIGELAGIEAGRRPVRHVPVGLRQLIEACVAAHRAQATRQGLVLTFACMPEIPATLVTDGAHLRQILLALIGNAVRHTRSGTVAVRARLERGAIAVEVEDSGPGLGSDRRETIFQPFADVASAPGGIEAGTGLSLAIARRLAAMLDGTLVAECGADGGARFVLRLPGQVPGVRLDRRAEADADHDLTDHEHRQRWLERRSEVLMAVDLALRLGEFDGAEIDDLAALVRDVAGSAAGFGEEELGRRAAALEHGLRAGDPPEANVRLAQALLRAAA